MAIDIIIEFNDHRYRHCGYQFNNSRAHRVAMIAFLNASALTNEDDVHPESEESEEWREDLFDVGVIGAGRRDGGADFRVAKSEDQRHDPAERPNDQRSADWTYLSSDPA